MKEWDQRREKGFFSLENTLYVQNELCFLKITDIPFWQMPNSIKPKSRIPSELISTTHLNTVQVIMSYLDLRAYFNLIDGNE